ncbi:tetratricopeptide repeat protein [Thalassotalea ponticola]|uniref:tetratricopeptide repeat protein n=1 Tax=Thalassotalea ponticola TaxID=1523392 RepID=UPI0025B5E325|nr:tetratricopeptide repeat protein [Thalassotalea ponticola]MDN3652680.1 tetratricopeptide repeat protein [Thalassotalea ponticola]
MTYINPTNDTRLSTLAQSTSAKGIAMASLLTLLSACSTLPETSDSASDASALNKNNGRTEQAIANSESEYDRLMRLPNAYKDNAIAVSEETKAQVNAALALQQTDVSQAKAALEAIVAATPQLSGVWVILGDMARNNGEHNEARNYYQRAVQANNNNYHAHNRLGLMQREAGEFEAAKASYQAALEAWGGFANAHLNLGILLDMYMGQRLEALSHYQTYQVLTKEQDNKVKRWIADISMQLKQ